MVQSLTVIPKAPFIASQIGLDPDAHPGTVEIIDGIQRLFFASQKPGMSSDNFREGMNSAADFWKFQVEVVRDFAPDYIMTDNFDPIIGALIGGVDTALIPRVAPDVFWKTEAAKQSTFMAIQAGSIATPHGFRHSRIDVRYVIMTQLYCDLCSLSALIETYPERFKHTPLEKLDDVGKATRLEFTDCKLTDAIRVAEADVLKKWRDVYEPPAKKRDAPALKIVQ